MRLLLCALVIIACAQVPLCDGAKDEAPPPPLPGQYEPLPDSLEIHRERAARAAAAGAEPPAQQEEEQEAPPEVMPAQQPNPQPQPEDQRDADPARPKLSSGQRSREPNQNSERG